MGGTGSGGGGTLLAGGQSQIALAFAPLPFGELLGQVAGDLVALGDHGVVDVFADLLDQQFDQPAVNRSSDGDDLKRPVLFVDLRKLYVGPELAV